MEDTNIINDDDGPRPPNKCRVCHRKLNRDTKDKICLICKRMKDRPITYNDNSQDEGEDDNVNKRPRLIIVTSSRDEDDDDLQIIPPKRRRKKDKPSDIIDKVKNDPFFKHFSEYIGYDIDKMIELDNKNKDKDNGEEAEEEEQFYNKSLEYEWLGSDISNIKDLIRLGKSYNPKKRKRHNLNLSQLSKLVKPLEELDRMIGLQNIKTAIFEQIIYFLQGLDIKNTDMHHTVIEGPPGVGKTQISHIVARIYKSLGFLKYDKVISVKRDDLVAGYLGQTALKTKKKIDEALGGVLFIDEAYSLGDREGRDSYSKEAIDTLTSYLSEHPHDLVVIIAGYKESLKDCFFSVNPGLERRFGHRFEITDYPAEDLRLIFFKLIKDGFWEVKNKDKIPISFFEKNRNYFKYNGGDMLNLFGFCKKAHAKRLLTVSETEEKLTSNKKKINYVDVKNGMELFLKNPENSNRMNNSDIPNIYI